MEILRINFDLEKTGVYQTNELDAFSAVAHIYNALRQTNRLRVQWPALEAAMEAEKKVLFFGDYPYGTEGDLQALASIHWCRPESVCG